MKKGPYKKWTPEAVARLRQLAGTMKARAIAIEVGCSYTAARAKMAELNLSNRRTVQWTPENVARLIALHGAGKNPTEIAELFGTHRRAITSQLYIQGLAKPRRAKRSRRDKETDPEIRAQQIRERVGHMVQLSERIENLRKMARKAA